MNIEFKEQLQNSYDMHAKERDKAILDTWKKKGLNRFLSYIQVGKQTRIVDLGSGTGQQSLYMKEYGLDVTCIDLSPVMVQTCLEKGLAAYQMDFYDLKFEDHSFGWGLGNELSTTRS